MRFTGGLLLALGLCASGWGQKGAPEAAERQSPGSSPPSSPLQAEEPWGREDAELTALAAEVLAQVAALRELPVRQAVRARYADKATFLRYVDAMEADWQTPERRAAEPWIAKLLGWVPFEMDLRAAQRELLASQVGGFYDPFRKTFFVMEGLHPDLIRILMAHELAHALDDQHFDLRATDQRLAERTDALLAHHAVAEGSAQVVMTRWITEHAKKLDQAALRDFQNQMDFEILSRSPRYLWQPFFGLYAQGQAFLGGRAGLGSFGLASNEALQAAFEGLPVSTEQILHPAKYWDPQTRDFPVHVEHDVSQLPADWRREFTDVLGELLVALCSQTQVEKVAPLRLITWKYTHPAASGWGGDRVSLLRSQEGRVLVWDLVWDSAADADEFWEATPHAGRDDDRFGRTAERLAPDAIRWVAWLDISREEALKVASKVQYSRRAWGKIPPHPGKDGTGAPIPAQPATPPGNSSGGPARPPAEEPPRSPGSRAPSFPQREWLPPAGHRIGSRTALAPRT